MEIQEFDDVFDALADTAAEAANMKARADLISLLVDRVKSWGLPQEAAAARLGITRPRLNDLMRGKLGVGGRVVPNVFGVVLRSLRVPDAGQATLMVF